MNTPNFTKSDIGAQAAWKGFSSQTLYIAYRLLSDDDSFEYYPEDIEDLVIKKMALLLKRFKSKTLHQIFHFQVWHLLEPLKVETVFLTECVAYMIRIMLFPILLSLISVL